MSNSTDCPEPIRTLFLFFMWVLIAQIVLKIVPPASQEKPEWALILENKTFERQFSFIGSEKACKDASDHFKGKGVFIMGYCVDLASPDHPKYNWVYPD